MKKLNITFCSFPDFSGNAKALYEYMSKRYNESMNYTWIVYNKHTVDILKKQGIKSILIGTEEFKSYIPKTNVFFTTQGNLDNDKIKAKGSLYIELWHGIGPKPVGFCQKNPSDDDVKGYGHLKEIIDYFIVPSNFWKVIWGAIFKVEYSRIKSLGMPIFDYFINSDGKNNLSKALNIDVHKYKKIIIYMPTFRQGFNHFDINNLEDNVFNIKEDYDESKLIKFLEKNNYLLCIKMHPGELSKINIQESNNIKLITEDSLIENKLSVNEIINAFDLLITDFSSIGTEFLFLNKPVLFNNVDLKEYSENRGLIFENENFWFPGPRFNNQKEMLKETKKLLDSKDYYKLEREDKKDLWFGKLKDGGCKEICDFIFEGNKVSSKIKRYDSKLLDLELENSKKDEIINQQESKIIELQSQNYKQTEKIKNQTEIINNQNDTITKMENTKGWKMLEKFRKFRSKFMKK